MWLAVKFRTNGNPGRACSTRVSNHHAVLEGDADTVYTRVHHLLTLPKVALRRDEFHLRSSDRGLVVPWLEEAIPLERWSGRKKNLSIFFLLSCVVFLQGEIPLERLE